MRSEQPDKKKIEKEESGLGTTKKKLGVKNWAHIQNKI